MTLQMHINSTDNTVHTKM